MCANRQSASNLQAPRCEKNLHNLTSCSDRLAEEAANILTEETASLATDRCVVMKLGVPKTSAYPVDVALSTADVVSSVKLVEDVSTSLVCASRP